jgi:serine protease
VNLHKKFIIPLILIFSVLLAGCEIQRSDDSGTIGPAQPVVRDTSEAVDQPTPETVPPEGQPPPDTPPIPADISTEQFPAPLAPAATPIEGKVLVKLEQQAAIQARSAELGSDQVVSAGLPTLDQVLRDIGASELQPVVQEVIEATGDTLESFSTQAEEAVQLYSVTFDPTRDPVEVAELLEQDPTVEYAEPDYMAGITARPVYVPVQLEPNDPYFKYQWNFVAIQAPAAWDRSTGQGVIVAVIDTGIDFNTPDLANTQRLPGYDFANKDQDPTDDQGHGTHVAGTIAQSTNNNLGVAGVAYNAHLLPVKVLGANGQGSYEGIIQGIYFAVDQGAKVINMSLAGRAGSQALQEAVQHAHEKGVVVVAAAGNSNSAVEFPAAYDDYVIAVGSSRFDNGRAPYSNFGPQIDIVAPGGDVGIDQNGDGFADGILQQTFKPQTPGTYTYLFFEGTSMASPHIAGVAALMLALSPNTPS